MPLSTPPARRSTTASARRSRRSIQRSVAATGASTSSRHGFRRALKAFGLIGKKSLKNLSLTVMFQLPVKFPMGTPGVLSSSRGKSSGSHQTSMAAMDLVLVLPDRVNSLMWRCQLRAARLSSWCLLALVTTWRLADQRSNRPTVTNPLLGKLIREHSGSDTEHWKGPSQRCSPQDHTLDRSDCQWTQWFRALEPSKAVSALQS